MSGVGPVGHGDSEQREVAPSRRRPPNLVKLHRKAKVALREALAPGESPQLVMYGLGDSAIIGTDRAAYVFKSGAKAGIPFSHRLKQFEYESIMRVDVRRGQGVDVVVIHAPLKISVCSSYWADERDDPWRARNAIPVALLDRRLEDGAARLAGLVARFQGERAQARKPGAPFADRVTGSAPPVLEHLDQLEQERSIQPVMVPGADAQAHGHGRRSSRSRGAPARPRPQ